MTSHDAIARQIFSDHAALAQTMLEAERQAPILGAAQQMITTLQNGGTIFICGNGGSAADAQHFAAELTGRFFIKTRRSLPGVALTTDTSALTAIANDYGYHQVFSRQIEGLGRAGDLLVGITTSGRSANILEAMDRAYGMGMMCVGLVGPDGSAMAPYCPNVVTVPHALTARVQEMHITVIHTWCDIIDRAFGE